MRQRGLGQVAKGVEFSTVQFDFLSRAGAQRCGKLFWVRKPERVLITGKTTDALRQNNGPLTINEFIEAIADAMVNGGVGAYGEWHAEFREYWQTDEQKPRQ
jgi:hypothetical protein